MKKKIVFLSIIISIIVISITSIYLYSTYATDPVVPNDSYAMTLTGDTTVSIPANSGKNYIYQIKNTNSGTVNYGLGYTSTTGNSVVYIWNDSTDPATGTISANNYKYIKIRIINNSNTPDTVTLSTILGYENGGDLITPNNVTIVSEKIYKVTFDANGGETPVYSKGVINGKEYGDLPTPTRDGYTFLGWTDENLPEEYRKVEYIQMDSTSPKTTFLTTGIRINNISKIELKYSFTNVVSYYPIILTSYTSSETTSKKPYICADGNKSGSWSISPTTPKSQINTPTEYIISSSITSTNYLKIGGWSDDKWTAVGRYYYVKIYNNNDELIRKFIPSYRKDDGVVGMYELLNGVFYESAGPGSFTAGNDVLVISSTIVERDSDQTLYAVWEEDNS